MPNILKPNWKLYSLNIEFQEYGDYKGKYVGKIKFNNENNEAFMFNLSQEDTAKYIDLVSEKLVASASHLGDKLLASLNLLPAPKTLELQPVNQQPEIKITTPVIDEKDDIPFL